MTTAKTRHCHAGPGAPDRGAGLSARRAAAAGLMAAWALLVATSAQALSFGRLSVQSSLGEPLRAQIQINSMTPSEEASLEVRLASPQDHRSAGLEYDRVLSSLQVVLVRQPQGQWVIQLNSSRAAENIFIDLLMEARWASGQQLMGYTLLVNPANGAPSPATTQVETVLSSPSSGAESRPASTPSPSSPATHRVASGETLYRLANQYRPEGVSLDQMLVALYRQNPQAFVGANMNRLKAGAVLNLPAPDALGKEDVSAAREMIQAHSADFGSYRARLASAAPGAASAPAPSRQAGGSVQARVQDRKAEAAATPDQLKLSRGGVKAASSPEASVSRQSAAQAAAQREAELERNVQALRQLQQSSGAGPASAASAGPAPASTAAGLSSSVAGASTPVAASAPVAKAETGTEAASAASAALAVSVAAGASAAASAVASAIAASAPASAPPAVAGSEGRLLDDLLGSRWLLPAASALVLLLASWGAYRLWRGRRKSSDARFAEDRFEEEASAGLALDTRFADAQAAAQAPGAGGDQDGSAMAELDVMGDVDPIAEADVYLSYGRDMQAEEILRDAARQWPERMDIRLKLLEVLALRRDVQSFGALALEVREMTQGEGSQWAHVASMGRALDPDNPLYGGSDLGFDDVAAGLEDVQPPEPWPQNLSTAEEGLGPAPAQVEAEDFSIDLGDAGATGRTSPAADDEPFAAQPSERPAPDVDLGGLELQAEPVEEVPPAPAPAPVEPPLQRKLALAREFMQIGDLDGARDLIEEVYAQASGPLKERARDMLDELG